MTGNNSYFSKKEDTHLAKKITKNAESAYSYVSGCSTYILFVIFDATFNFNVFKLTFLSFPLMLTIFFIRTGHLEMERLKNVAFDLSAYFTHC